MAVLDEAGDVVAGAPGAAAAGSGDAVARLWEAACRVSGAPGLEHVVVPVPGGAVAVVAAHGHRAVAVTGPDPAVALLVFDLRTCLGDAFAADGEVPR